MMEVKNNLKELLLEIVDNWKDEALRSKSKYVDIREILNLDMNKANSIMQALLESNFVPDGLEKAIEEVKDIKETLYLFFLLGQISTGALDYLRAKPIIKYEEEFKTFLEENGLDLEEIDKKVKEIFRVVNFNEKEPSYPMMLNEASRKAEELGLDLESFIIGATVASLLKELVIYHGLNDDPISFLSFLRDFTSNVYMFYKYLRNAEE